MLGLRVLMLGQGRIELDGQALTRLLAPKQQAIVYYLACAGDAVPRSRLAALLWGGLTDDAARGNLRGALSRLRRWLPDVLAVDGERLGFAPSVAVAVDVQALARAQAAGATTAERVAAVSAWRGPLLDDFEVGAADEFEDWLASARQRAQQQVLSLRGALLRQAEAAGARDEAIAHARALLDIDETDEEAYMALMRVLAAGGQRIAAIAQYEACRAALAERLGARPSAACYALYTRIHGDAVPASVAPVQAGATVPSPAVDAPPAPPALVGRDAELAQIVERLADPACRWLTLVGPGGVGKTWLALALADRLAPHQRHGVLWFSGRDDADGALRDPESLSQHVIARTDADRLLDGALLLVLDNLETLAGPRAFASLLARRAPGVKVLATSQQRIGGAGEWLFEIGGLSLERRDAHAPASSPAAQLFASTLRRLMPHFDADAQAEPVERVCALLGGLPIALELAARSAFTAGIGPVLARLQAGALPGEADALADAGRHPGLLPVLEDAWARLDDAARAAARRLAALPVAFDATLAQAVGVDVDVLAELRAHSWLAQPSDSGIAGAEVRLAFHPVQQMFVRRQGTDVGAVLDAVVDHLDRELPPVPPLQAGFPDAAADAARCTLAASAAASPALLAAACSRLCAHGDADRLAAWVERCVALLWAADRLAEAAALLAQAVARTDLPAWRAVGWGLLRAEMLNGRGESTAAQRGYVAALARHGLCDEDLLQSPWAGLPAALRRVLTLAGEPPPGPARAAFRALLLRSCAFLYAMLAFSPDPQPMLRVVVLMDLLSRRLGLAVAMRRQGLATGAALTGQLGLGERIGRTVGRARRTRPEDPRLDALFEESRNVFRIALGDWPGVVTELDATARRFEALRCGRHRMETLALAAKLCFFEGRLDEAHVRFATLSELALQRPGESWRAWGPIGLCEVLLCLERADDALLQRLYQRAADVMTEMENIDAAYTLRRLGLAARLAWRAGDADAATAAVRAGVAAAGRMRAGYWSHEGLAGLSETLLALLAAMPGTGATARALEAAWTELQQPLHQHGRLMRPAAALVLRLHGQHALLRGDRAAGVALLERAVRAGDPQGMRVEAARACDALAAADPRGPWSVRGRDLWHALRAPMHA